MYEMRPLSPLVLWFVLGISVLAIGAAYVLGSFFLLASGSAMWGNAAGAAGMFLAVAGVVMAVGSIFAARAGRASGTTPGSRPQ